MRTGVFGGTFDPPHQGHIAVASAAIAEGFVDCILFVPTANSWHKSPSDADVEQRLAMISLLIAGFSEFEVSTCDIDRGGNTYSIDTINDLQQEFPEDSLSVVLGADSFNSLATWHRAEELIQLVEFVVATRPGIALTPATGTRFSVMKQPMPEISSTDIRKQILEGCTVEELAALTNSAIATYIFEHELYR